jgi:hypothetical protein
VNRITQTVLAALRHGVSKDDDLAARDAIKGDLVARGRAKRKLGSALVDAELAVANAGIARPSRAHVQRVAALALTGHELHAGDPDAAEAAYIQLPVSIAPTFPLYTLATGVLVLAGAGALAYALTHRQGPAPRTWVAPTQPESGTAYTTGGVPLHDPAIDKRLAEEVTNLVIAANRDRASSDSTLKAMRAETFGHGAHVDQAWQAALDAFSAALLERNAPNIEDHLREAVRDFGEQLNTAGYGYFLEGRIKGTTVLVQSYRVEEVVFVTAGGKPRRVLSLNRLDRLNTAYAALGLYNEDAGDPTLHLERIAEYVATSELPTLAPNAMYPLAEDTWLAEPAAKALALAFGTAVRREYAGALGTDADAGGKIAGLLAERAEIIEGWREHLEKKHIVFSSVDNLFVPVSLLDALEGSVPHYQRVRVEAIDDSLASLEAPRIHARVHDLVAATVRRHEAQHGFDFDRDTELHYPDALAEMLGPPELDGNPSAIVASARAELSGYLSQIINDPATPQAALAHLAANTFPRSRAGTGEFYAGIVVLEGLAKQLGADTTLLAQSSWHRGLDRERLATLSLVIANAPDAKLHEAARALWLELFEEPPTEIIDVPRRVVVVK